MIEYFIDDVPAELAAGERDRQGMIAQYYQKKELDNLMNKNTDVNDIRDLVDKSRRLVNQYLGEDETSNQINTTGGPKSKQNAYKRRRSLKLDKLNEMKIANQIDSYNGTLNMQSRIVAPKQSNMNSLTD